MAFISGNEGCDCFLSAVWDQVTGSCLLVFHLWAKCNARDIFMLQCQRHRQTNLILWACRPVTSSVSLDHFCHIGIKICLYLADSAKSVVHRAGTEPLLSCWFLFLPVFFCFIFESHRLSGRRLDWLDLFNAERSPNRYPIPGGHLGNGEPTNMPSTTLPPYEWFCI